MKDRSSPLAVVREFSAERLNAVVNDPSVRPWVGAPGNGYIDTMPLLTNPNSVLLMAPDGTGGLLFTAMELGQYEVHTQFVAGARGAHALRCVMDALHYMFTRTDCVEVLTRVPEGNKGALGLVRAIKGELMFTRQGVWPTDKGLVSVGYYAMPIMSWAKRAPRLPEAGHWFHEKLEVAKSSTPNAAPLHEDDAAHDRFVGAAVEMIRGGEVQKGIAFYNRWAKWAGYGPVSVIASNPVVIDIGDAILAVNNQDFEVLLCR